MAIKQGYLLIVEALEDLKMKFPEPEENLNGVVIE